MRYMIRLVYHCKRGKVLEMTEGLKAVDQVYVSQGFHTKGKIYVDRSGHIPTVSISATYVVAYTYACDDDKI
jgi:hypothetical protein